MVTVIQHRLLSECFDMVREAASISLARANEGIAQMKVLAAFAEIVNAAAFGFNRGHRIASNALYNIQEKIKDVTSREFEGYPGKSFWQIVHHFLGLHVEPPDDPLEDTTEADISERMDTFYSKMGIVLSSLPNSATEAGRLLQVFGTNGCTDPGYVHSSSKRSRP